MAISPPTPLTAIGPPELQESVGSLPLGWLEAKNLEGLPRKAQHPRRCHFGSNLHLPDQEPPLDQWMPLIVTNRPGSAYRMLYVITAKSHIMYKVCPGPWKAQHPRRRHLGSTLHLTDQERPSGRRGSVHSG
jgi:hypothetical protein